VEGGHLFSSERLFMHNIVPPRKYICSGLVCYKEKLLEIWNSISFRITYDLKR
jgi:hypothetical protein